ncbi:MAG: TRAP transporter small permease [Myxococcota bacterium]|nr:TRAP transporter small permease [Myxococcota bacterium]
MSGTVVSGFTRVVSFLHRAEDAALTLLLGTMVVLAPLQIFLRLFFDAGLPWADPMIRVLVLWVGLFGAISASRGDRHITIDVLPRLLPPRARAALAVLIHIFTVWVCALLAWHSGRFVQSEQEFGGDAFLGIPAWALESVMPFAFAVIALRYAWGIIPLVAVALGQRPPETEESAA